MENKKEQLVKFKMYNLTDVEEALDVSYRTLLNYIKEGKLQAVKIGGKWKVSEENLKAFINGEN